MKFITFIWMVSCLINMVALFYLLPLKYGWIIAILSGLLIGHYGAVLDIKLIKLGEK